MVGGGGWWWWVVVVGGGVESKFSVQLSPKLNNYPGCVFLILAGFLAGTGIYAH